MAEGPLVHRYARRLRSLLQGKEVRIEFGLKKLKPLESSLQGIRVQEIEAHGKQFRIHLSDHRILLIHLMMWGSWRFYKQGEAWDKPRDRARVTFRTGTHEVVVFSAPIVRLLTASELQENPSWGNLGPDPLRSDFSPREVFRRLAEQSEREIGEVLLDQQVIAGAGNILRIEILFGARVHPHRRVASLTEGEKKEILHWILRLFGAWAKETGRLHPWIRIYRRSGKPCPNCGYRIEFFRQSGRITYACPHCQL